MENWEHKLSLELKDKVIKALITRKKEKLTKLREQQVELIGNANLDDIDYQDLVESPREAMMAEMESNAGILDNLRQEIDSLELLNSSRLHRTVAKGALIRMNTGLYLIAVGEPKWNVEGIEVTGISMESPLFKKMEGNSAHTEFHLQNMEYFILEII
ncbi:hypothetical protein K1F50_12590 [Muricauda oceani]|uniref:Transcription elongation factor n=1 Tax=Flagellimonas oceani TaxID=2698672 RepID=A0A6G7IZG2_9FLAO|nr:hypothetical protein [Allomuricauda oceani]MBW8243640.1 hypothetical protein [Allomuricauda oceani]QII43993.1 hypothetical protein GVT53_04665 [Allomuricauda oceani]